MAEDELGGGVVGELHEKMETESCEALGVEVLTVIWHTGVFQAFYQKTFFVTGSLENVCDVHREVLRSHFSFKYRHSLTIAHLTECQYTSGVGLEQLLH